MACEYLEFSIKANLKKNIHGKCTHPESVDGLCSHGWAHDCKFSKVDGLNQKQQLERLAGPISKDALR